MPSFVVLNLVASGHLARIDVVTPQGRIGWVEWRPRDRHPIQYQGEAEGRLVVHLDNGFDEREAEWIADVISALVDLTHGPSGIRLAVAHVGDALLARRFVDAAEVVASFDPFDERVTASDDGWWPTDDPIRIALAALPTVLSSGDGDHDRGLPAALLYYKLSTSEFAFMGDSIAGP